MIEPMVTSTVSNTVEPMIPAEAAPALLLEDGSSFLLLEDGSSKLLLG